MRQPRKYVLSRWLPLLCTRARGHFKTHQVMTQRPGFGRRKDVPYSRGCSKTIVRYVTLPIRADQAHNHRGQRAVYSREQNPGFRSQASTRAADRADETCSRRARHQAGSLSTMREATKSTEAKAGPNQIRAAISVCGRRQNVTAHEASAQQYEFSPHDCAKRGVGTGSVKRERDKG